VSVNELTVPGLQRLSNAAGLSIELFDHGAIRRMDGAGITINLFPGNTVEGGPANLWLRRIDADGAVQAVPLLGPQAPLALRAVSNELAQAQGDWQGLRIRLQLRLAAQRCDWFWHLEVENLGEDACTIDVLLVQDVALAPYGAIRLNEYYVSHYLDLAPLAHPRHGALLAARQNQAAAGRHPWLLMGSLGRSVAWATDALQWQGLGVRAGASPLGVTQGLPSHRLQHEHALIALQEAPITLAPRARACVGFFGHLQADHPAATAPQDLDALGEVLAQPQARPAPWRDAPAAPPPAPSLFALSGWLAAHDFQTGDIDAHWPGPRRHEEFDGATHLSFFGVDSSHVVLRAKELRVHRPHGHILRSGRHLVPDESALTSTVWMGGVFHAMLTQGHVSINRLLSTTHGWLGQERSHGLRVFVDAGRGWQQLGTPSAFEIAPERCRWLYRYDDGLLEVTSEAQHAPQAMALRLRVLDGPALRLRLTLHLALGGDDGTTPLQAPMRHEPDGSVFIAVPPGSELAARFPDGGLRIEPESGSTLEQVHDDSALYEDKRSRGLPFVCIDSGAVSQFGLRLMGRLVDAASPPPGEAPLPAWTLPTAGADAAAAQRLADILPWYRHNALVHYLSPRGLEQYSGGGWGTRDVCQGPLEMLLALGRTAPVRDLLCRVFAAQNADGDWPQWFMFFERERQIRAGDSHGDIVFWPLLGLAQYLVASGDAALLDEPLPFHAAPGEEPEVASVWQHVARALALIAARRIPGTHLAAYGHGDWNDSLQPADPALRERLCSAWTVTLHHQVLTTMARALGGLGRSGTAASLRAEAAAVQADFQRLLVADGVVAGYALFEPGQPPRLLLHPSDTLTGLRYSLLPMMHAILDDLLSPGQAEAQLALIEQHLLGPDGARLFDRPLHYRGGPMTLFQRAESSSFFGREIGVMYMHAHLRHAQALAHMGRAQAFFDALARAHPIALRSVVPSASLRQANCYYSSSDAAFADRYEAQDHYERIGQGTVALDGGWRIYSSGPGIAIALVVGHFLGLRRAHESLVLDPVMPPSLDGLRVRVEIADTSVDLVVRLGPAGCGTVALTFDGVHLPFTPEANPYRRGGACVAMVDLRRRLAAPGPHALVVQTA
jgi:1,2-beta-oligoglucan phosphorylase